MMNLANTQLLTARSVRQLSSWERRIGEAHLRAISVRFGPYSR